MNLSKRELFEFLEFKYDQYNNPSFIDSDPISVPHQFTGKEDIEISGFLTAVISWGNRVSIIKDANKLMGMMDWSPHNFILHSSTADLKPMEKFYHRTFNGIDTVFFVRSLKNIYQNHGGLEPLFKDIDQSGMKEAIIKFRDHFLEGKHESRSEKHLSDPAKGASAKRILMFLRWMVRDDKRGVDFGLWKKISPEKLMCPLDVHSGNAARKLGLLDRKQNDWKAVEELTLNLQRFDPTDPVKYDFALFGLGAIEKF